MKNQSTKKNDQDIPELKREQLGGGVRGKYHKQFMTAEVKSSAKADVKNVWERTSGAWQGGALVREPQGGCETVQMTASISHSKDPDLQKVPQALMRAAEKARQLAEQTGTPFVTRKSATEAKKSK